MPEAFVLQNQIVNAEAMSVLEAAEALGVSVVASASILQVAWPEGFPRRYANRWARWHRRTDRHTVLCDRRLGITTALVGMEAIANMSMRTCNSRALSPCCRKISYGCSRRE